MELKPGDKLGPYEIVSLLGKGGMGEVWKARDPRLDRAVAIKVSKAEFSERFTREARMVAQLNHPNICHLYDVGPNYLVMELLDSTPLKGPLPLDKAVEYAAQILDALDAAHRKGITHRDLKPANILVTKQGIKLLDFGLAKQDTGLGPDDVTRAALTVDGQITGTLQYISPEQLQGKEADARSDIFSFGCVLYEMLSGTLAFAGSSSASVIAAILEREPQPLKTTPPLDRVIRTCLAKEPDQRFQNALDLKRDLVWANEDGPLAPRSTRPELTNRVPWLVAAILLMAALALGSFAWRQGAVEPQVLKVFLQTPENAQIGAFGAYGDIPMISPDGRHVAFAAQVDGKTGLWLRDLDALSARLLPGTDGAGYPFWSLDSRWVAFFADRKLKKIDVTGGPEVTLCEVPQGGRSGTWNKENLIVYAINGGGLFRVPAAGGTPTPLTEVDAANGEVNHRFPSFLPDGRHFVYTGRNDNPRKTRLYVDSIDAKLGSNTRREVLTAASNAVYVSRARGGLLAESSGYLLFVRENTLMAQPFDATRARTTGEAVPVAERVDYLQPVAQGQFSASQNGLLVYTSNASIGGNAQLTWFDRTGKPSGTVGTPAPIGWASISPDGSAVAADRQDASGLMNIWRYDLARGVASRLTFGPTNTSDPIWSPDGSKILFCLQHTGSCTPYQKAASGVGEEEPLDKNSQKRRLYDWSRDGRYLIADVVDPKTNTDIWVYPTIGDRKSFPYINSEFREVNAKLSRNSRFLAYVSDESKRAEVYVQTFPEHGGKWQVSTGGGNYPVWSRDGRELFFISADRKLMAIEIKGDGKTFEASVPKPLFEVRQSAQFDVGKDGRFLIHVPQEPAVANVPLTVVVNWQAALKR